MAILGAGLWKSRFGADPRIAGKQIEIDTQKFTVIGVVDPVLQFMEQAQLYVPLAFTAAQLDPNARGHQNIDVVGRLRSGVTLDQARAEMKLVAARMTRNLPGWYPPDWNIELDPLADAVAGELRTPLLVLLGAVAMVLLIGCVNVANLLLARATARQKEIGLRIALGAGRARIVRQLLTESLLLARAFRGGRTGHRRMGFGSVHTPGTARTAALADGADRRGRGAVRGSRGHRHQPGFRAGAGAERVAVAAGLPRPVE